MIFQKHFNMLIWWSSSISEKTCIALYTTRILEMLGRFLNLNKMKTKRISITWANILFTIEHREHNKCLNGENFTIYAQNELISNLMPATGLKIVGTGHVYHGVASPLLFKTVWRRLVIEVMSFWSFGVGIWSILVWYRFTAAEEFVVVLTYFSFNDVPNVLYRWKIWTAGRPIQHPHSSTTKPCCCNSCSMWFCIVQLEYT